MLGEHMTDHGIEIASMALIALFLFLRANCCVTRRFLTDRLNVNHEGDQLK